MRVAKVSVIEQVIKQLQSLIMSGEYIVGQKLPAELELCRDLGVSRSTVREAYRMLSAYGMVEMKPGRGAFVRQLRRYPDHAAVRDWFIVKEAELFELMEVRMAIEPIAVRFSILRGTDTQLKAITDVHECFLAAVARNDALELALLDETFHTAIVEASNNRLLIKLNRLIVDEFREYRTKSFSVRENVDHALEPHTSIVNAIMEKNIDRAIEAMTKHLAVSLGDIESVAKKSIHEND